MTEERGYPWRSIGARIKEARVRVGLTQRQLSEMVGVSPHAVWSWEAGKMKPTPEHLLEVAYRCETSTDWLLGRDVVEAEILKEADVSFRNAIEGLPMEDLESIMEFIHFVRGQRRRKEREDR
jgi:transcriptional regulator with XRE-family HTH domain